MRRLDVCSRLEVRHVGDALEARGEIPRYRDRGRVLLLLLLLERMRSLRRPRRLLLVVPSGAVRVCGYIMS